MLSNSPVGPVPAKRSCFFRSPTSRPVFFSRSAILICVAATSNAGWSHLWPARCRQRSGLQERQDELHGPVPFAVLESLRSDSRDGQPSLGHCLHSRPGGITDLPATVLTAVEGGGLEGAVGEMEGVVVGGLGGFNVGSGSSTHASTAPSNSGRKPLNRHRSRS